MAVDFDLWAQQSDTVKIYLVELTARRLADGLLLPLYLADRDLVLNNRNYLGCAVDLPRLTRQADDIQTPNHIPSWGELTLSIDPQDRPDAYASVTWEELLSESWTLRHQPLVIYLGGEDFEYGDFRPIFQGRIDIFNWEDRRLVLTLADKGKDLELKIPDYEFPDTPLVMAEARGNAVPGALGYCQNVRLVQFIHKSLYNSPWFPPLQVPAYPWHRFAASPWVIDGPAQAYHNGQPKDPEDYTFIQKDVSPPAKTGDGAGVMMAYGPYTGPAYARGWLVQIDSITRLNEAGDSGPEIGLAAFRWSLDGGETWEEEGRCTWKLLPDTVTKDPAVGLGTMALAGEYASDVKRAGRVQISREGKLVATSGWQAPGWIYDPDLDIWVPNPTSGPELLTDGGLEVWTNPTTLTHWTNTLAGTSTVNREGTIKHGGAYACRLDIDAAGSNCRINQNIVNPANRWVRVVWDGCASASGKKLNSRIAGINMPARDPGAVWTRYVDIAPVPGANIAVTFNRVAGASASSSLYFDDASAGVLDLASCLAVRNYGRQVAISAEITTPLGVPAGVVARLDDPVNPLNYVLAWINPLDTTKALLTKVVAGTPTNLIDATVTYVAGAALEIRWAGPDTAQLWYNGAQVGTGQDVSAVPAGNWAGLFGPDAAVQFHNVTTNPAPPQFVFSFDGATWSAPVEILTTNPIALAYGLTAVFAGATGHVGPVVKTVGDPGTGTMTAAGAFSGDATTPYQVVVLVGGVVGGDPPPPSIKWTEDGGVTWSAPVEILNTSPIALSHGVEVAFSGTLVLDDVWEFTAYPPFVVDDLWSWDCKEIPIPLADGVAVQFCKVGTDPAFALGDEWRFILMSTFAVDGDLTDAEFTMDLRGPISPATGAFVQTIGELIQALPLLFAGWSPADFDAAALAAFIAAFPGRAGWMVDSPTEINKVIDDLLTGIPAFYTINLAGQFYLQEIAPPAGTPRLELTDVQILKSPEGDTGKDPLCARVFVRYGRNWGTNSNHELATQERLAWLTQEWRQLSRVDPAVRRDYPWAQDLGPLETALVDPEDALALVLKLLSLYGVPRRRVKVAAKTQPYRLELGQAIKARELLYLILGMELNLTRSESLLNLWR